MTDVVFDIEANGLLDTVTKIHCVCLNGKIYHDNSSIDRSGTVLEALNILSNADRIIGHNIIGYDIPLINKLYPDIYIDKSKVEDTYILSQLLYPNEMSQHSIKAWGEYFGVSKVDQEDWTELSSNMIERCIIDTDINFKLWRKILPELESWDWEQAKKIEYNTYDNHIKYCTHWYLDIDKLHKHIKTLTRLIDICQNKLNTQVKKITKRYPKVVNPFKKDGELSSNTLKWNFKDNPNALITSVAGEYCKIEFEDFNFNSSKQVINWLTSIGWKPDTFNVNKDDRGNKINTPSLQKSKFIGVPNRIRTWLVVKNKAQNRLATLMRFDEKRFDNTKLKTFAYTSGTNSGRYRHIGLVNIPKADGSVFFGSQMREIFCSPSKKVKVLGFDFSALEYRIEGHFTHRYDNGKYAKFLLEQDIHQFNADIWGISRTEAKSLGYALSYQCSPRKVEELYKCSSDRAKEIFDLYWEARPSSRTLITHLEKALLQRGQAEKTSNGGIRITDRRAFIKGIDGRKLFVRSPHSLKNLLIQNAGMMAVKMVFNYICGQIKVKKLKTRPVLVYHDEINFLIDNNDQEIIELKNIIHAGMKWTGDKLGLKVPLECDIKVGDNWKEVH